MIRSALAVLAILVPASMAHAADAVPGAANAIHLSDAAGVVYFTKESGGLRVVATVSPVEGASPVRFVSTLADGQSMELAVPGKAGTEAGEVRVVRVGDTIRIEESGKPEVRASLD
jgi:hypothetical protein